MEDVEDKVFVYLRLRAGEEILSRSKIREVAGLGSLLADFFQELIRTGGAFPPGASLGGPPVLEYVDSNTERVLISLRADPARREQVVEGCIPPAYHRRMLDPDAAAYSVDRFAERATDGLSEEERSAVHERLASGGTDLLARIRQALDAEGNFSIRLPLDR